MNCLRSGLILADGSTALHGLGGMPSIENAFHMRPNRLKPNSVASQAGDINYGYQRDLLSYDWQMEPVSWAAGSNVSVTPVVVDYMKSETCINFGDCTTVNWRDVINIPTGIHTSYDSEAPLTLYLDAFSARELEHLADSPEQNYGPLLSPYVNLEDQFSDSLEQLCSSLSPILRIQGQDGSYIPIDEPMWLYDGLKLATVAESTRQTLSYLSLFQPDLTENASQTPEKSEYLAWNYDLEASDALKEFAFYAKNERVSVREFVNDYIYEIPEFREIAELAQRVLSIPRIIRRFLSGLAQAVVRSVKVISHQFSYISFDNGDKQKLWPLLMAFKNN